MASKSGKISWVMEVSENGELKPFLGAIDCWKLGLDIESWTNCIG